MAKFFLQRTLTGWIAADSDAEAAQRKFKAGEVYRAEMRRARDYRNHCRFMCLLEKTYENLPEKLAAAWPTPKIFRRVVAYKAGHCDIFYTEDGEEIRSPRSYSYDELPDEDDFVVEFGAAMAVCAQMIGMSNDDLAAQISRYAFERYGIAA